MHYRPAPGAPGPPLPCPAKESWNARTSRRIARPPPPPWTRRPRLTRAALGEHRDQPAQGDVDDADERPVGGDEAQAPSPRRRLQRPARVGPQRSDRDDGGHAQRGHGQAQGLEEEAAALDLAAALEVLRDLP